MPLPDPRHAPSKKRSARMMRMLELLTDRGVVRLAEFTDQLGVSEATVRRDLASLEDDRLLVRTHGAAARADARIELPVALRDTQSAASKRAIAVHVAQLVPAGRHAVALSGGSTTGHVARLLASRRDLTVITNSLTIAGLASAGTPTSVVMTGGILRPESLELVGVLAERTFAAVNIGTAILGADGVSAVAGVTTHDETEARTNAAMVAHAGQTIVVADGTKIGRAAMAQVAGLSDVTILVTDDRADPDELRRIEAMGVRVVAVPTAE